MSEIPEGWYADPQRPGEQGAERWWNGFGWTAHTRETEPPAPAPPAAAPRTGPETPGPPAGATPVAPGFSYPQPPQRQAAPWQPRPQPGPPPPGHAGHPPGAPGPTAYAPTGASSRHLLTTEDGEPLADVGKRIVAYLVDMVFVASATMPLYAFGTVVLDGVLPADVLSFSAAIATVWYLYQAILLRRSGQTIAKQLLGLRVRDRAPSGADPGGDGVSWRAALLRPVLQFVALGARAFTFLPLVAAPLMLADLVVLLTQDRRRSLHDILADTVVVTARPRLA